MKPDLPLSGAWFRKMCWHGGDITVPFHLRGPDWLVWKFGAWRQVLPSWRIANKTYSQLGPTWTENSEWTFDKPVK